jgi:hypothetical protein
MTATQKAPFFRIAIDRARPNGNLPTSATSVINGISIGPTVCAGRETAGSRIHDAFEQRAFAHGGIARLLAGRTYRRPTNKNLIFNYLII